MQWIKVKDRWPENNALVVVVNAKGFNFTELALFFSDDKTFVKYDPRDSRNINLEVTHWLPIPEIPNAVD